MDCYNTKDVSICYATVNNFFIAGRTPGDINLVNDPEIKEIAEKGWFNYIISPIK